MTIRMLKVTWFLAFVLIFFAFIMYSIALPLFGADTEKAWQWLVPNLLPPVGIVFGIEIVAKRSSPEGPGLSLKTSESAGSLAFAMSLVYLAALLISVFGVLFVSDPIELLNMSNYWLGPLLAITTAVLGARFAKAMA